MTVYTDQPRHGPEPSSHPIHTIPLKANLLLHLLNVLVLIIVVLSRIGNLVLQHLDELVEDDCDDGAQARADPVDPVFDIEDAGYDARPEAARGIERAAGVVHTDEFGDEEREADADGGYEGGWNVLDLCGGLDSNGEGQTFVLLHGQHEDGEHQLGSEDCLDEDTPRQPSPTAQCRPHIEASRENNTDEETAEDTPSQLRNQQQRRSCRTDRATQHHRKRNRRIEQTTTNAKENPHIHHQTEPEHNRNIQQDRGREPCSLARRRVAV